MLLLLPLLGLALASGTNPTCPKTTIRKEVNDVSESDWKMIVETIQKAQQTPEKDDPDNLSVWEAAADLHNELAEGTIHNSCMFFFWHRFSMTY